MRSEKIQIHGQSTLLLALESEHSERRHRQVQVQVHGRDDASQHNMPNTKSL